MAWSLLAAALLFAVGGSLLLGGGLADPQLAGPLKWSLALPGLTLLEKTSDTQQVNRDLPPPPYTLEVAARLSPDSDPSASWLIQDCSAGGSASFRIQIYGDGTFSLAGFNAAPVVRAGFPHLLPPGSLNRVSLDVRATGAAILRLNEEIAWQGRLGSAESCWELGGRGGLTASAKLSWETIALYSP